jgi:hypothetical protein
MNATSSFIQTLVMLAKQPEDRGARTILAERTIADCLAQVGPDSQAQLARLKELKAGISTAIQTDRAAEQFLRLVFEFIDGQSRRLEQIN